MKILFIEDEKGYAYLIREYLKESPTDIDYELHHVMSLNKAIAELDKQQFDVILMDLGLPDSYGLASFEKLNHVNPDIPIIILTGYDIEEESIKAVSLGAQDYLVKDKINSYILKKSLRYSVERKKSQAALKESQEKYRMLFEDAGDYIFILNPDEDKGLIIKDANISAFSEHGYSREEMIGMPVLNLETEIFKRTINERRNLFKKPGDKAVFETEHIRKDGSVFPVEVSSRLLQIGNQKPFFLSIERNITERKKADEALKKSEEIFHTIYDMESDCVKLLDGEGRLLEMNPAGLAMIQANLEQVQGGLAVNLVADEDKEAFN
ncbi:MAG: PAS domain S-box protein, partial [Ignavibacteriae bacterium]|nr:PAS domain S-box protein [Ignavibacteriota bacterium]